MRMIYGCVRFDKYQNTIFHEMYIIAGTAGFYGGSLAVLGCFSCSETLALMLIAFHTMTKYLMHSLYPISITNRWLIGQYLLMIAPRTECRFLLIKWMLTGNEILLKWTNWSIQDLIKMLFFLLIYGHTVIKKKKCFSNLSL